MPKQSDKARFTLLILSFLFASAIVNARTIKGQVISASDNTVVSGANCRLMADGKPIIETQANEEGVFMLDTDLKTALELEITMPGFSLTDILIEPGSKHLNLGVIYLDEGTTLDEVTVSGNSVVHSKGRTIVYPTSADVKASATSLGLFQKLPLPGLIANPINRNMSVDGGSPVILINGVPSSIDEVNSLQPKDIEKIEYSRFTPARYADSGKSGFISITLKKRDDGGQIYVWGRSALTTTFVDANLRASYHQGKSQFSLMYVPSWRNYHKVYDTTVESYIGSDFRIDLEERDRNPFNYDSHQLRLKYDYSPTPKTLFSATLQAMPFSTKRRTLAKTTDSELGIYDSDSYNSSKEFTPSLDLFLRQDFNEKNSLEVEVVGTLSKSAYYRDNRYIFSDGSQDSYTIDIDSRRQSLISEICYVRTFSENTSLSAGIQNTVSHSKNRYLTSDYTPILTENNNYAYVSLGQSVGRFYFAVSSGAKLFWIKNDINRRNFIRNLSTARIAWNISNSWNLQATFRYAPDIPGLSQLTDYPQQVSPYLVSNGNPDLKVTENFLYSIGANFTHEKFQVSLQSSYNDARNGVYTDVVYLKDKLFLSQSANAKYRRMIQNELTFRLGNIHGFGANLYMNLSHFKTAGADWRHKLTSLTGHITLWWNKGPFTITYWRIFPGKYLEGQNVFKVENGDALQIDWRPDRHWTIGAGWMYMFDKKGTRYPSWNYSAVNPSSRYRYIKNNANMVVLTVSYSADFGSLFKTGGRNLNNTDSGSSLLKF